MTLLTWENKRNAGKAIYKKNDHRDAEEQCQTKSNPSSLFWTM